MWIMNRSGSVILGLLIAIGAAGIAPYAVGGECVDATIQRAFADVDPDNLPPEAAGLQDCLGSLVDLLAWRPPDEEAGRRARWMLDHPFAPADAWNL